MTPEAYLARVRALLPVIRERAVHTERPRRLPEDTLNGFQAAGLFRCLQARWYGGYELDPGTFHQAAGRRSPARGQRRARDLPRQPDPAGLARRARHAGPRRDNPEKAAAIFGRSEFGLPPLDLRF